MTLMNCNSNVHDSTPSYFCWDASQLACITQFLISETSSVVTWSCLCNLCRWFIEATTTFLSLFGRFFLFKLEVSPTQKHLTKCKLHQKTLLFLHSKNMALDFMKCFSAQEICNSKKKITKRCGEAGCIEWIFNVHFQDIQSTF